MADPQPAGAPKVEDPLAIVKALAEASTVLLAFTFIGGWSYLASYYSTFGLNPLELDFPTVVVNTLAIFVLYKSLWPLIASTVLVGLLALAARRLHSLKRGWVAAALSVLLLVVGGAGASHGRTVADRDMEFEHSALPLVGFAAKTDLDMPACVGVGKVVDPTCILLLHAKSAYYFFLPIPDAGEGSLNLYMLPESDVIGFHLLRGLDRNSR